MAFLGETGATNPRDIFMPEGLCSRCGVEEPSFEAKFLYSINEEEKDEVFLGFCGDNCFVQFMLGVKAAKLMQ